MEDLGLWHVFVDNRTDRRFCQYGYRDALTFDLTGDIMSACDGKTEIPLEEWTDNELLWAVTGILEIGKRNWLAALPGLILQAMKECGVSYRKSAMVMRKILRKTQDTM